MRILRPASEAEVVATFLRAEIESARWGDKLRDLLREDGVDESMLAHPDVEDAVANAYRARILDRHRGWLQRIRATSSGCSSHSHRRKCSRCATSPRAASGRAGRLCRHERSRRPLVRVLAGRVCVRLLRGQNAVELLDAVERGEECEE